MIRFWAAESRSDLQCADANLVVLNVPFRCTLMTSSHSCSVMLKTIRSRRMPATLTRTSSRPNCSMAVLTRSPAAAWSEMSAPLATALPPAAPISAATSRAGPASRPEPSTAAPRSLTTTQAPSLASSFATDLPIPRPAPVTTATRPSSRAIAAHQILPVRRTGGPYQQPPQAATAGSHRRQPPQAATAGSH